jgi:hypothetical protein
VLMLRDFSKLGGHSQPYQQTDAFVLVAPTDLCGSEQMDFCSAFPSLAYASGVVLDHRLSLVGCDCIPVDRCRPYGVVVGKLNWSMEQWPTYI